MKQTKVTMQNALSFFLLLLLTHIGFAQAPQKFNYQGIARNAEGNPLASKQLHLKLSILPTADAREAEYEETQLVTTNEFGLYTLQIGNGKSTLGSMKDVSWETGNKYIKVAIDLLGGTQFKDIGTTQLLSVPYAIYADKAGVANETIHGTSGNGTRAGTSNFLSKFDGTGSSSAEINSQLFDNGTNIGIGTTSPAGKLHSRVTSGNNLTIFENTNAAGTTRMNFQADGVLNYTTVQKRGSTAAGVATVSTMPLANMFSFGNNTGPMLLNSQGNMGIAPTISGVIQYKFLTDTLSGNVGLAGNAIPTARVHINNTQGAGANVRVTNNTTGHTSNDGLELSTSGNIATIANRENSNLNLGTNSLNIITIKPDGNTDFSGQIKIAGGAPGVGKVLTSDATGLASWQTPSGGGGGSQWTTNGTSIYKNNTGNVGIGIISPTSLLHISDATTTHANGIVRAEYTGSVDSINIVAMFAKSRPVASAGIGLFAEGGATGVYGKSDQFGLYGELTTSAFGTAVFGNGGSNGVGVDGFSTNVVGVSGNSVNGRGMEAISNSGVGLYAESFSGNGLEAVSVNGNGIDASSIYGNAIYGHTDTSVSGYFQAGNAISSNGLQNKGVLVGEYTGTNAQNAVGVFGKSTPPSVAHGIGVKGLGNWIGVFGVSAFATGYAGYFQGNSHTSGTASAGTKAFKIDHPLDPENKYLYHSSVESNDMMNLYSDNVITDANGFAIVTLPTYFESLNKDFRYQLTTIGSFAQAIVSKEINNNQFTIQTNQPNVKVSWMVMGTRKDPVANANRIIVEVEKEAHEKGTYLNPAAYGQPESKNSIYKK